VSSRAASGLARAACRAGLARSQWMRTSAGLDVLRRLAVLSASQPAITGSGSSCRPCSMMSAMVTPNAVTGASCRRAPAAGLASVLAAAPGPGPLRVRPGPQWPRPGERPSRSGLRRQRGRPRGCRPGRGVGSAGPVAERPAEHPARWHRFRHPPVPEHPRGSRPAGQCTETRKARPGRPSGSRNRRPAPRYDVGKSTRREPTLKAMRERAG
jgi:hypothetical protein